MTLSCWECASVDDGTRMSRTTSIGNSRPMRCALPSIADTATRRQFISGRVQKSASLLSAALPKLRPLFTSCRASTVLLLSKSGLLLPKYGATTREQGISNQLRASCALGRDHAWAVPIEQAQRKKRRGFTHKAARQMRRTVGLNSGAGRRAERRVIVQTEQSGQEQHGTRRRGPILVCERHRCGLLSNEHM